MRGPSAAIAALLLSTLLGQPAHAADEKPAAKSDERPTLPDAVKTQQHVSLPGRTLSYTTVIGALPAHDDKGKRTADIFYTAYFLNTPPAAKRPITFAFNGGPGAASAFLQLGLLGPRRLEFGNDGETPSSSTALVDNPDTWLDFTDLVFVDPVGTGYSRPASTADDAGKPFWTIDGDIASLSRFIADFLTKNGRMASPKFIVGESYGGFRGPRLAHHLQVKEGVGVAGLILVSPALDFSLLSTDTNDPLPWITRLPSMAATRLEAKGKVDRAQLKAVEDYASGEYLLDLVHGREDPKAAERMAARLADLTGLDPALVKRLGGHIDIRTFARELHRDDGTVVSLYDTAVSAYDAFPNSYEAQFDDPILSGIIAPVTSAFVDYAQNTLNYHVDEPYVLLSLDVNSKWDFKANAQSHIESTTDLRQALAIDPKLKVLIAHGLTDLVTSYYADAYLINQLPALGDASRVTLKTFAGGHMFYSRAASRTEFRTAAKALYPN